MRSIALVLLASSALAAAPQTEKQWDAELNRVYGAMMRKLPEPGKKPAKAAQLAWIRFRDAEFARLAALGGDASEGRTLVVRHRVEELGASLALLGEGGAPAAGSAGAAAPGSAAPEAPAPEAPAPEAPAAGGAQTTTGTFTGIEQGDYAHLKLTTADGSEEDFFVRSDENGLKQLIDAPQKFVGKKISVQWQERDEDIPEAGGKIKIRVALGAKVLK